jgi:putative membrane protein
LCCGLAIIAERYVILTVICGLVLLIVGLYGVYITLQSEPIKPFKLLKNYNLLFILVPLLLFLLPLRILTSESFNIRSAKTAFKVSAQDKNQIKDKINFKIDTNTFSLYDWVKAKSIGDNTIFINKEITASGFITPTKTPNVFTLSRFVVACCVVDATPVGVLVEYDYNSKYQANDWLEIKGKFEIKNIEGSLEPVVIPSEVKKINQPDDIYLNRN